MRGILLLSVAAFFSANADQNELSPITRVVELLQSMSTRMEADHKAEEDAYETFVCWAKSIISQKTASNAAAQTRADSLQTYINDLQNGRIELTTERQDLEKELETVNADIEIAQQMRAKEKADFDSAKEEMDAAIAALDSAITVLRTATQAHTEGVLMSITGKLGETAEVRSREAAALSRAVELGNKVLTKGDSVFLQRLLTGDVPERADWKTLNRKATFKMNYKARSFKIQGVLAKLLETFSSNLADAAAKETAAITTFNTLMGSKGQQKTAAETALSRMEKENGARGMSLQDASGERQDLLAQITADEGYIGQVQTALTNKKAEWQARQKLRADEIAAFSQAISILHSDDARDTFKKSFASQGFLFLQEGVTKEGARRINRAVDMLRVAEERTGDERLADVAAQLNTSHFTEVVTAIDNMLTVLRNEEASDITAKETCESDRAHDTREAITKSRAMDELSDTITTLTAKVAELEAEVKEKEAQVTAINNELIAAADQRAKENKAYLAAKQDDEDAAGLVRQAKSVLQTFYRDNGLMLVQGSHKSGTGAHQPFTSVAGEAPPPPPKTWEAPYGGKTEESTGILAILEMIHDDINADITKATTEEGEAVALYTRTKTNLETERGELTTSIGTLNGQIGAANGDIQTADQDRYTKKGELKAIMDRIAGAAPNCDFVTINFHVRSQNRKIEIDGLEKAKAILSGASFDGLPDPNREIKPGDAALVQHASDSRRKFLRRQS